MPLPTIEQVWSTAREHNHRGIIVIVDQNNAEARESALAALVGELRRHLVQETKSATDGKRAISTQVLHTFSPREKHRRTRPKWLLRGDVSNSYQYTPQVLGRTFGIAVLEDLEYLTPNALCQIVETVSGGGLILLCLPKWEPFTLCGNVMNSHLCGKPKKLYIKRLLQYAMRRKKTQYWSMINATEIPGAGFTLGTHEDDTDLKPLPPPSTQNNQAPDTLNALCINEEQSAALEKALEWITSVRRSKATKEGTTSPKASPQPVLAVTAARGRGKSALLGMLLAQTCVSLSPSNVVVFAPCILSVKTLLEFAMRSFKILGFQWLFSTGELPSASRSDVPSEENSHSGDGTSSSASCHQAPDDVTMIVSGLLSRTRESRIKVRSSDGTATTVYVLTPNELQVPYMKRFVLEDVDVVFIDEAAAIPLPLVQSLLNANAVALMASTVHGYEGTGRSLAIKLTRTLETEGRLEPLELKQPVRYAEGDRVEAWLMKTLCLEGALEDMPDSWFSSNSKFVDDLKLSVLNKEALFDCSSSDNRRTLRELMAIFVSSHYRNNPNDMWMLADNSCYQVVALHDDKLRIYAAAQLAFEGGMSPLDVAKVRGRQTSGDMLMWKLYDITETLTDHIGMRVVRIACHPDATGKRLGTILLDGIIDQVIERNQKIAHTSVSGPKSLPPAPGVEKEPSSGLFKSILSWDLDRLIGQKRRVGYVGTSFGLSERLLRFWTRSPISMVPFYLAQVPNEATGELTIMLIRALDGGGLEQCVVRELRVDTGSRFTALLADCYRTMPARLAASLINVISSSDLTKETVVEGIEKTPEMTECRLAVPALAQWNPWHYRRLNQFARGTAAAPSSVRDLWPDLALAFTRGQLEDVVLSPLQLTMLIGLGLQRKGLEEMAKELSIPIPSLLNQYNRLAARFADRLSRKHVDLEPPTKLQKTTNLQFKNLKRS